MSTTSQTVASTTALPPPSSIAIPISESTTTAAPSTVAPPTDPTIKRLSSTNWEQLDAGPLSPRIFPQIVWTGTDLIVASGCADSTANHCDLADAAAYRPSTRTWRRLADIGRYTLAWTGDRLIGLDDQQLVTINPENGRILQRERTTGRPSDSRPWRWSNFARDGGRFYSSTGLSPESGPARMTWFDYQPRQWHVVDLPNDPAQYWFARWTGRFYVVVTGTGSRCLNGSTTLHAYILDTETQRWHDTTSTDTLDYCLGFLHGTDDAALYLWGSAFAGAPTGAVLNSHGLQLDPATGRWTTIPDLGVSNWESTAHLTSVGPALFVAARRQLLLYDTATGQRIAIPAPSVTDIPDTDAIWTGSSLLWWGSTTCYPECAPPANPTFWTLG